MLLEELGFIFHLYLFGLWFALLFPEMGIGLCPSLLDRGFLKQGERDMRLKTVLCPVDFSKVSSKELGLASQICERFAARLVVQHNIDYIPPIYLANAWMYSETHMAPEEEKEAQAERRLQELFAKLPSTLQFEGKITFGHLDESILHLGRELPADLIVMGTHGASSTEHASHTDRVLAQAPCPILTVRDEVPESRLPAFKSEGELIQLAVLLPMDFSTHSLHALEFAFGLMEDLPVRLHLLHIEGQIAWDDLGGIAHLNLNEKKQQRLAHSLERLKALIPEDFSARVNCVVRMGSVVDEIVTYANDIAASFVIMGAHPKNIFDKLLFGVTSKGVLHRSPCPVWLVPTGKSSGSVGHWASINSEENPIQHEGPGPEHFIG